MRENSFRVTCLIIGSALCVPACWAASNAAENAGSAQSGVVLEVDGVKFTETDIERKLPGPLFQARNSFYQAERGALEQFVSDYLLEREAKKEGITVSELIDRHVNSTIAKPPSEETLRVLYETIDTKDPYELIRDRIVDHLKEARVAKAKAAYIETLRSAANIDVRLGQPRATVPMEGTPVRGAANATIALVEYADYECPYCQQIQPMLLKLEADYKGKISMAFKDSPLPNHAHAQKAAEAAHCAEQQGKYWEYHDMLFATRQLDVPQLKDAAAALKLDAKAFDQCLDSGAQAPIVKKFLNEAQSLQVQGTPSFLINGRFFAGLNYEQLRAVIEEELKSSATHDK